MARKLFFRNVRARDQLEIFLLSAISSVLVIRLFLHLTGYISLGGGDYHIAHMLYGGFMMLAAVSLPLTGLGARVLSVSAIVGGVGFGFFIDELGKFITSDNDYFFNPTDGLIYAIFISLYLMFNFGKEFDNGMSIDEPHRKTVVARISAECLSPVGRGHHP